VYGVALATGLYMDYTFLPLWTALTAVWLLYWWLRGHHWWRLLGWGGVTLLAWFLYQPVYPQLLSMLARLNNVGLTHNIRKITELPAFEPSQYLLLLIPIALGILLGAILLWLLLRRQPSRLILTILILVGFMLITFSMMLPRAYTVKRLLLTGWPFIILLVAWLITQLPSRRREVWYGLLGVSLATSLAMIAFIPKDDWRGLVSYINVNVDEQAVVLIDPKYNDIPYNYYEPNIPAATIPVTELEETAIPDVWLVIERAPGSNYLYTESEQWLDENRDLVEIIPFYRLELRHYK